MLSPVWRKLKVGAGKDISGGDLEIFYPGLFLCPATALCYLDNKLWPENVSNSKNASINPDQDV